MRIIHNFNVITFVTICKISQDIISSSSAQLETLKFEICRNRVDILQQLTF